MRVIGLICIFLCWSFNVRGMRPAVWLSYATGVAMAVPVIVLAVGPFVTGNISNHAVNGNAMSSTLTGVFGESASTWHQFGLIMVWLYVLGWSTYGPEAPATFAPEFIDTKNDTRKAIMSTGAFNVFLSALLPLAVVGTLGYSAIAGDLTGIVYMIDVLKAIVGDFFGGVLVVCLCAGLLLSMNTATMDGSRALFGMARDGLTVKQLSVLNSHHVPGRAMTLDMLMNVCLLMFFPSIFFVLAAGNLGYMLSHVLALSGVLLLRKDRPAWPRPIKLGPVWMYLAGAFAVFNLLLIIFGLMFLKLTGYAWNYAFTDPSAFTNRIILVGVLVLVAGVAGYVIGQRQVGRPFRWTDPSDESPTAEAYETAGMADPGNRRRLTRVAGGGLRPSARLGAFAHHPQQAQRPLADPLHRPPEQPRPQPRGVRSQHQQCGLALAGHLEQRLHRPRAAHAQVLHLEAERGRLLHQRPDRSAVGLLLQIGSPRGQRLRPEGHLHGVDDDQLDAALHRRLDRDPGRVGIERHRQRGQHHRPVTRAAVGAEPAAAGRCGAGEAAGSLGRQLPAAGERADRALVPAVDERLDVEEPGQQHHAEPGEDRRITAR